MAWCVICIREVVAGLPCIKNDRFYIRSECNEEVCTWAVQRLGRAWCAHARNEISSAALAGITRELAEQVNFFVICRGSSAGQETNQRKQSLFAFFRLVVFLSYCHLTTSQHQARLAEDHCILRTPQGTWVYSFRGNPKKMWFLS